MLIIGCTGLAAEVRLLLCHMLDRASTGTAKSCMTLSFFLQVAKNIVLAGVGVLHLMDDTPSTQGAASNFLNTPADPSSR